MEAQGSSFDARQRPWAVDLPPTTLERGKMAAAGMKVEPQASAQPSMAQKKKFRRRQNSERFYNETHGKATVRMPRKAPVPGYTGFFQGMNCDYGVSKAFGLPMEVMQVPRTPELSEMMEDPENGLESGYGTKGKHRMGQVSLFAGKGYQDREKMMKALQKKRITGEGKEAPYDSVPGDGLAAECHIHTDSVYHQYPPAAAKVKYHKTKRDTEHTHLIRRPKGSAMKGFAPPLPLPRGSPGTTKYSVFNLPTLREVQARKTQFTRV